MREQIKIKNCTLQHCTPYNHPTKKSNEIFCFLRPLFITHHLTLIGKYSVQITTQPDISPPQTFILQNGKLEQSSSLFEQFKHMLPFGWYDSFIIQPSNLIRYCRWQLSAGCLISFIPNVYSLPLCVVVNLNAVRASLVKD
jgi:hypothetical protein